MYLIPEGLALSIDYKLVEDRDCYTPDILHRHRSSRNIFESVILNLGDFAPEGHLTISGDTFGCHNWFLVDRD